MDQAILQSALNFGGLGVALWMIYSLHVKLLEGVREELREERERCDRQLEAERTLWRESMSEIMNRFDRLETQLNESIRV